MAASPSSYQIQRLPLASTMCCCIKAAPPPPPPMMGQILCIPTFFSPLLSQISRRCDGAPWAAAWAPVTWLTSPVGSVARARQYGHNMAMPAARRQRGTGTRRPLPLSQRGWATLAPASARPY